MKINTSLTENIKILGVAVSGGVDSMVLLHCLAAVKPEFQTIKVINVDHSIRTDSSARDSTLVAKTAADLGLPLIFKKLNPEYLTEKGGSVENKARIQRYSFFDSILKSGQADAIATAHHAEDNAETVLLHIFRGAGLKGACGIKQKNDRFVRPLLQNSKHEILDYATVHGIPYAEDETNQSTFYSRNFLRKEVIPMLAAKFNSVTSNINSFSAFCARDEEFINSLVPEPELQKTQNGVHVFIKNEYFCLHDSLLSRLVFKAFAMLDVLSDVESTHINSIKYLYEKLADGKKSDVGNSCRAVKNHDGIVIFKASKHTENTQINIAETAKKLAEIMPRDKLIFDTGLLPPDAVWRFKEQGDAFTSFGGCTKSLKKYFIDKKIPCGLREFVPVLASKNTVFLIAGLEISDSLKVQNSSGETILFDYDFYTEKLSQILVKQTDTTL